MEDENLDAAFIAGIRDELGNLEESEKNIQALSQVFRYYARHARQLSEVLVDWARGLFPWELIASMHLVDDILLMDNTGRYKVELAERVHPMAVNTFRKAPSDAARREVVRILQAWIELKVFDPKVLDSFIVAVRNAGAAASKQLDEAMAAAEEDEDASPAPSPPPEASPASPPPEAPEGCPPRVKRPRPAKVASEPVKVAAPQAATPSVPKANSEKTWAVLQRLQRIPVNQPFEMLGLPEGAAAADIRKAYRKLALLIHPDKNPGMEDECKEALIRLQQGREHAEGQSQQQVEETDGRAEQRNATRSDATCAAASATVDSSFQCKYPGCDLPPCKQCANSCCTRNITHCHMLARSKGGFQCFFHPPPRAWARNA